MSGLRDALEELHRLDDSVTGYRVCDADEQTWPCETARLLAAHPVEPAPVADQERMARILREHVWIWEESRCSCGDRQIEFQSRHQADALLAAGAFRSEAEVKAEALTEAAAAARKEAADSRTNNGRCESEGLADWLDEYAKTVAS